MAWHPRSQRVGPRREPFRGSRPQPPARRRFSSSSLPRRRAAGGAASARPQTGRYRGWNGGRPRPPHRTAPCVGQLGGGPRPGRRGTGTRRPRVPAAGLVRLACGTAGPRCARTAGSGAGAAICPAAGHDPARCGSLLPAGSIARRRARAPGDRSCRPRRRAGLAAHRAAVSAVGRVRCPGLEGAAARPG